MRRTASEATDSTAAEPGRGGAVRKALAVGCALIGLGAAFDLVGLEGISLAAPPPATVPAETKPAAKPAPAAEAKPKAEAQPAAKVAPKTAKKKPAGPVPDPFIRIARDDKKQPTAMETAVVRYVRGGAVAVDPRAAKADNDGNTPLHLAAENGDLDTLRALLEKGAPADAENKQGQTPIHLAAKAGKKEAVKLLLESPPAEGERAVVDLIGVVHVGDRPYYDELNKRFEGYDAVLYELVAPPNTRIPKDAAKRTPSHPLGFIQTGTASMLDLEFQLHRIDYTKKNFVHADMTPEQVTASMEKKGETIFSMMAQAMAHGAKQQARGKSNEWDVMLAFFADDRSLSLKRALAEQFEDLEEQMAMFEGPDGSTIITERNKVCLEVMRKELAAGKKKLAIFYGAGHMRDMAERLVKEFGFRREGEQWLKAWDLTKVPAPARKAEAK